MTANHNKILNDGILPDKPSTLLAGIIGPVFSHRGSCQGNTDPVCFEFSKKRHKSCCSYGNTLSNIKLLIFIIHP